MPLEITYWKKNEDQTSKVVVEFGIRILDLDISFNRLKLIKSKNGNFFVSVPSFKDSTEEKFIPYWSFESDKQRQYLDVALKLILEELEKEPKKEEEIPF